MEIKPAKIYHNYLNGVIEGKDVAISKKLYKDAKTFYKSIDTQRSDDTVMYEVYSYAEGDQNQVGNLNWGLTIMQPILVDDECNITRGHFHADLNCAEMYFCLGGEGLLLLMDEKGECHAEKMEVGSVHHIDGKLAHRLVNTGDSELKVGACWPSCAGHDYARVEKMPFPVHVFKKDNKIVIEDTYENRI